MLVSFKKGGEKFSTNNLLASTVLKIKGKNYDY